MDIIQLFKNEIAVLSDIGYTEFTYTGKNANVDNSPRARDRFFMVNGVPLSIAWYEIRRRLKGLNIPSDCLDNYKFVIKQIASNNFTALRGEKPKAENDFPVVEGKIIVSGRNKTKYLVFRCPWCKQIHYHGGDLKDGETQVHLVSHCPKFDGCYYIAVKGEK